MNGEFIPAGSCGQPDCRFCGYIGLAGGANIVDADDDLLPDGCAICNGPLHESDAVLTGCGRAHEDCAEAKYGTYDPNRDPGIPKPGM